MAECACKNKHGPTSFRGTVPNNCPASLRGTVQDIGPASFRGTVPFDYSMRFIQR